MRLFLVLLFAAFALPAAAPAACHGGSTMSAHAATAMTGDRAHVRREDADLRAADHTPAHHEAVAEHSCVGCIPPSAWTVARIDDVPPADTAAPIERAAVFDIGMTAAPMLRPPRTA
ncbi:hypothetical protein [Sphingomonas sp. PB2P12]|uniref:hypothetical protein n=1 Tax=Sphingomonas sandaracina TaxID=3096157 RepID=UPI002FC90384